jgi:hypothetical protein
MNPPTGMNGKEEHAIPIAPVAASPDVEPLPAQEPNSSAEPPSRIERASDSELEFAQERAPEAPPVSPPEPASDAEVVSAQQDASDQAVAGYEVASGQPACGDESPPLEQVE